eukprot:855135-Pelagomonas_calceolata.AAC.1
MPGTSVTRRNKVYISLHAPTPGPLCSPSHNCARQQPSVPAQATHAQVVLPTALRAHHALHIQLTHAHTRSAAGTRHQHKVGLLATYAQQHPSATGVGLANSMCVYVCA